MANELQHLADVRLTSVLKFLAECFEVHLTLVEIFVSGRIGQDARAKQFIQPFEPYDDSSTPLSGASLKVPGVPFCLREHSTGGSNSEVEAVPIPQGVNSRFRKFRHSPYVL